MVSNPPTSQIWKKKKKLVLLVRPAIERYLIYAQGSTPWLQKDPANEN
jgi:hypothetical protein